MAYGSHSGEKLRFFGSRPNIVLIVFLAIAGFYLVAEHSAHLLGWLPWLLLLACPLMHFFMHGGHGGHGESDDASGGPTSGRQTSPHQH